MPSLSPIKAFFLINLKIEIALVAFFETNFSPFQIKKLLLGKARPDKMR
jgi:hypothetical protein